MLPQTIRDFITSRGLTVMGGAEATDGQGRKIATAICGGAIDWLDFIKKLSSPGSSAVGWTVQMPDSERERKLERIEKSPSEALLGYKVEFVAN
jgi:hypothetical protein